MDDPDWTWPAWKFGMRRDDLFTSLHERYNTFTYSLQDPEAFHHDVYELSNDADTPEQFHRLMAERQQQRLRELNESLDTLAVEIIGNPKLMGSDQWHHAVQLFRTKSYDSVVRYFASYLPNHYLDRHDAQSSPSCSSFSETDSIRTMSTKASSADRALLFDDEFFPDGPIVTVEPCALDDGVHHHEACSGDAPSPARSETISESSVSTPSDADSRSFSSTNPPSRSMSFSGSESGHIVPELTRHSFSRHEKAETCSLGGCDTVDTSERSLKDTRPSFGHEAPRILDSMSQSAEYTCCNDDNEFPTSQFPDDDFGYLDAINTANDMPESDTPTPRQEGSATGTTAGCYVDRRPAPVRRMPSLHQRAGSPTLALSCREPGHSACDVRRSPEEAFSRIQKPTQDAMRKRPKGRRRPD